MSDQRTHFSNRLARITDPRNLSYHDPETGMRIPRRLSIGQIKRNNFGVDAPGPVSVLMAVLLGALALIAGRYLRFVVASIPERGTDPVTLLLMDIGLALVVAMIVGGVIGQKTLRHLNGHILGIALMLVGMHNLVWMYPDLIAQVFPQAYLDQVRSMTEPTSIYLMGKSYSL